MIDITSDFGRIGRIGWINSNQEFALEVVDSDDRCIAVDAAWWGAAWFAKIPKPVFERIETVMSLLEDEPA